MWTTKYPILSTQSNVNVKLYCIRPPVRLTGLLHMAGRGHNRACPIESILGHAPEATGGDFGVQQPQRAVVFERPIVDSVRDVQRTIVAQPAVRDRQRFDGVRLMVAAAVWRRHCHVVGLRGGLEPKWLLYSGIGRRQQMAVCIEINLRYRVRRMERGMCPVAVRPCTEDRWTCDW